MYSDKCKDLKEIEAITETSEYMFITIHPTASSQIQDSENKMTKTLSTKCITNYREMIRELSNSASAVCDK
jgi:hypothetical protein